MKKESMKKTGIIKQIVGPIVDVYFEDHLPAIKDALVVKTADGKLVLEVAQHLGLSRVRAIAMDTTDGLARGAEVEDTGAPISVPVGGAGAWPSFECAWRR